MTISVLHLDGNHFPQGQLAEHLLMFDTVGVYATTGKSAAEALSRIAPKVLDLLVSSDSLTLLVQPAAAVVLHGDPERFKTLELNTDPKSGERNPLVLEVVAAKWEGNRAQGFMTMNAGRFQEDFDEAAKDSIPREIRDRLLETSRVVEANYDAILDVSDKDLTNVDVLQAACISNHINPKTLLALGTQIKRKRSGTPQEVVKEFDELLGRIQLTIIEANHLLSLGAKGYSVVGDERARAVVEAKLRAVFLADDVKAASQAFRALLDLHSLPSVADLVDSGHLSFEKAVELRDTYGTAFRKWFRAETRKPSLSARQIEREWTQMLRTAANGPSIGRRMAIYALEQLAGLIHPLLGSGVSFIYAMSPEGDEKCPYFLFDYLKSALSQSGSGLGAQVEHKDSNK